MFATTLRADVREPAVAGAFYPAERREVEEQVARFLSAAPAGLAAPLAVIAPHAGYVFSGGTAGKTFAALKGATVKRVILLGPSHHAAFRGAALPAARVNAFATPLGEVPLDSGALATLRKADEFDGPPESHGPEHCLEVELPFLQMTVGNVPIVPVLIGHATDRDTAHAIANALAPLLGDGTIVVVSSDFTHHGASYGYAPFGRASDLGARLIELGRATAERAAAIDPIGFEHQVEVSGDTVCGARPIQVLLELLDHAFSGTGKVVDLTTSGEVSRNWNQVVTYAGVSFTGSWRQWQQPGQPPPLGPVTDGEKTVLLALARATLDSYLNHGPALARWFATNTVSGNLQSPAGVFVTLHNTGERAKRDGRLRGCIGVMEARERLVDAVIRNAVSAAHDPRFPAFTSAELPHAELEISVLSPMRPVPGPEAIQLGLHGVTLEKGRHRAVFLPQVATETGWDRDTFLSQLSLKAGLSPEAWRSGTQFQVFTAQVFSEH